MEIISTNIPDIKIVKLPVFQDERGFFCETYQKLKFKAAGINENFVQDNHSGSIKGTLRGLHYQLRHTQGKLVRAIVGEIFDVVVDLRKSSPTFGKWVGVKLSAANRFQLWVPKGFAHGFYTLSDWAEVHYKATDYYAPQWERSLRWDDPQVGIEWHLADGVIPLLSNKDANAPLLQDADLFD